MKNLLLMAMVPFLAVTGSAFAAGGKKTAGDPGESMEDNV